MAISMCQLSITPSSSCLLLTITFNNFTFQILWKYSPVISLRFQGFFQYCYNIFVCFFVFLFSGKQNSFVFLVFIVKLLFSYFLSRFLGTYVFSSCLSNMACSFLRQDRFKGKQISKSVEHHS